MQQSPGQSFIFAQESQQQVLRLNVRRPNLTGLIPREEDHAPCFLSVTFKHNPTANRKNSLLPGTPERQAQNAPRLGTTAEDVTPADHIIALAIGLAFCMEGFSVCTPKKGRCSNNQRSPAGQPSGFPVPPTV